LTDRVSGLAAYALGFDQMVFVEAEFVLQYVC
jgi:hypothetical protein